MNKPLHYISIILVTIALTLALTGCKPDAPVVSGDVSVGTSGGFNADVAVVCLNNVKYWHGHKRLAPYYNPQTLALENC